MTALMWAIKSSDNCDDDEDPCASVANAFILVAAGAKLELKVRMVVSWHWGLAGRRAVQVR